MDGQAGLYVQGLEGQMTLSEGINFRAEYCRMLMTL
jgi:hypothetical protein